MTSTTTENIRLTITVTPEVHETFQRFSKAAGMSLGRAMGEWLGDTLEAAQFMAQKMEEARAAPKAVIREMHAYALGLSDETGALMREIAEKGRQTRRDAGASGAAGALPPSGNTGGKGPQTGTGKPVGRSGRQASK